MLALAVDAVWGEPPERFHPVAWMGRSLEWLEAQAPHGEGARFAYGGLIALGMPLAWAALARLVERTLPWPLQALALKPAFAGRALLDAGQHVELALQRDDLESARQELRSLVSRPTASLDAPLVAAAAVESLAENLVDSWIAPLLAYSLFGMAGAYAYRAENTADAMWGYRTPRHEWLGKAPARLDDLVNFVPSRLGALLMCSVAFGRRRAAFETWRRDAALTSSPNAGQTMACAAGALRVRLEKSGHYVLNAGAPAPDDEAIAQARRLVSGAMWMSAALLSIMRLARHG